MLYDPKWEKQAETAQPEPWRDLLLKAADLLEQRGHTKNQRQTATGEVCFLGALSLAMYGNPESADSGCIQDWRGISPCAENDLSRAFANVGNHLKQWPVHWNNAVNRTGAEVIATMRGVARA